MYALTSRVTTFDDDLTPVVEEKETPDSVDELTTASVQRLIAASSPDDERMDVHRSSSDSDPESRRHQGTVVSVTASYGRNMVPSLQRSVHAGHGRP